MTDDKNQQFIVDAMLRKMGKFLRIMGVDTIIAKSINTDNEIIQKALSEKRILITMDKQMHKQMSKNARQIILIENSKLENQLIHFFKKTNQVITIEDLKNPVSFKSRCSNCNSPLKSIPKDDLINKIPKETYSAFDRFWICPNKSCEKIYWQGSHWKNIEKTIHYVKEQLRNNSIT